MDQQLIDILRDLYHLQAIASILTPQAIAQMLGWVLLVDLPEDEADAP